MIRRPIFHRALRLHRNCDALELFMSNAKSRTIPPLRVGGTAR
jgi:hypothetical protein